MDTKTADIYNIPSLAVFAVFDALILALTAYSLATSKKQVQVKNMKMIAKNKNESAKDLNIDKMN